MEERRLNAVGTSGSRNCEKKTGIYQSRRGIPPKEMFLLTGHG
jgi:hypothetical protein